MTVQKNDIHFEKAYVVRVNRTRRIWMYVAIAAFIIALPIGTYFGTYWYLGEETRKFVRVVDSQAELLTALRAEIDQLEQHSTNFELSSEVDKGSLEQMRKEMVQSQAQIDILNEQIRFYQSLMDPNPEKGGVYLETVDIEPADDDGDYSYNIIVAQRSSNHQRIKGRVDVELIADESSEAIQTFSLSELTEGEQSLPLGFKFFQQLDGDITLPEGFNPTKIRVTVRLDGDSAPRVDETYAWKS